jgi:hypothetical protein
VILDVVTNHSRPSHQALTSEPDAVTAAGSPEDPAVIRLPPLPTESGARAEMLERIAAAWSRS